MPAGSGATFLHLKSSRHAPADRNPSRRFACIGTESWRYSRPDLACRHQAAKEAEPAGSSFWNEPALGHRPMVLKTWPRNARALAAAAPEAVLSKTHQHCARGPGTQFGGALAQPVGLVTRPVDEGCTVPAVIDRRPAAVTGRAEPAAGVPRSGCRAGRRRRGRHGRRRAAGRRRREPARVARFAYDGGRAVEAASGGRRRASARSKTSDGGNCTSSTASLSPRPGYLARKRAAVVAPTSRPSCVIVLGSLPKAEPGRRHAAHRA